LGFHGGLLLLLLAWLALVLVLRETHGFSRASKWYERVRSYPRNSVWLYQGVVNWASRSIQ